MTLPTAVTIGECGPRDGLQAEAVRLSTDDKVQLVEALIAAGVRDVEVGSFVRPEAVPQMADSEQVLNRVQAPPDARLRILVLNMHGLLRVLAHPKAFHDGHVTATASEAFVRRNQNRSMEDSFTQIPRWIEAYRAHGVRAHSFGIMAAFGCNFEGDVPLGHVLALVERARGVLADNGGMLDTLRLSDTMGWANPRQVRTTIGAIRDRWPDLRIGVHFHDTRGLGMANALAALELGVTELDSSLGGIGGCPFAGNCGPAGNICTEDLVLLCHEMGIETGLDLDALIEAATWLEARLGRTLPGKVMKGGSLNRFRTMAPT